MAALDNATDTSFRHVLVTTDGGQIRYVAAHRRLYVIKQGPGGRHVVTTPVEVERARLMARRILELCDLTEANGTEIG